VTVREIRLFGDPVLASVCDPIVDFSKSTSALVRDLLDTTELPGRAGVAAPQIGVSLRAFSFHVDGKLGYLLNPMIVDTSGELVEVDEGCLSVPGHWHKTPRYEFARVEGFNLSGEKVQLEGSGLMGQMIQHELDHLDGKLYLDRLTKDERKLAMREIRAADWFIARLS
jgi:peptide deformylase